jgi:hypothetical protein
MPKTLLRQGGCIVRPVQFVQYAEGRLYAKGKFFVYIASENKGQIRLNGLGTTWVGWIWSKCGIRDMFYVLKAVMEEMRNAYEILVGKPGGKNAFGRPRCT